MRFLFRFRNVGYVIDTARKKTIGEYLFSYLRYCSHIPEMLRTGLLKNAEGESEKKEAATKCIWSYQFVVELVVHGRWYGFYRPRRHQSKRTWRKKELQVVKTCLTWPGKSMETSYKVLNCSRWDVSILYRICHSICKTKAKRCSTHFERMNCIKSCTDHYGGTLLSEKRRLQNTILILHTLMNMGITIRWPYSGSYI